MKPVAVSTKSPLPEFGEHLGRRVVRGDVDQRYRKGLLALVDADGNMTARIHIRMALEKGPSRGGVAEAMAFFGKDWDATLLLTVPIVEACEVSLPGFGKWLNWTGFGNDKTMIRGFVAWAEHKCLQGKVMTEIADRATGKLH